MADDTGETVSSSNTGDISAGRDISGLVNTGTIIFYSASSRQDGSEFTANIPPLPHIHQPRKNEIIKVKKLLNGSGGNVSALTSVHGWPGVGKTTFLAELAHERDLWEKFTDGIIWISLGQNPDTLDLLMRFATGLGFDKNQFANPDTNSLINAIHSRIVQKKFLVLIDDAWDSSDVTPFLFGGCDCACLVATRSPVVAKDISPENTYTLEEMSEKEGMELFAKLAPSVAKKHGTECADLLKQLSFLPLIIKITGKMLNTARSKGRNISEFIQGLKADSAAIINAETPDDVQRESKAEVVSMLIDRSLNLLDERERRLFAMLSVFGEKPIHYDLDAIKAVWGAQDPEPIKDKLVELGLLELESEDNPRYQMHALLVKYGNELLKQVTKNHPEELRVPHIRHAGHYRKVLWNLNGLYLKGGASMMKALWDLDNLEWPNIQRAQQWAGRNWKKQDGSVDLTVAEIVADFPNAGAHILSLRLHSKERIKWHESALLAIEEIITVSSGDDKIKVRRRKGALLDNLGNAYQSLGESRKAIEHYEQAHAIASDPIHVYNEIPKSSGMVETTNASKKSQPSWIDAIFSTSLNDAPTGEDTLGFAPHVKTLGKLLTHKNTTPPITVSVEGDWGSGKTSFMMQLRDEIRKSEDGNLTVFFNGWRHEKSDELWSAFAFTLVNQLIEQASFWKGLKAYLRLIKIRWLPNGKSGWIHLLLISLALLVTVVPAGGYFLYCIGKILLDDIWLEATIGATILAIMVPIIKKLKDFVGNPLNINFTKLFGGPDYEKKMAFIERFHKDFAKIIEAFTGDRRIYIFIDDLDRCEIPKAAELMQALNLMISENDQIVFVLGIERNKISAGFAAKHKDLWPLMSQSGMEYGDSFIEKFIQIPFILPTPSSDQLANFISSNNNDVVHKLMRDVVRIIAPTLGFNPRRIKSFLNLYRLYILHAHGSDMLSGDSDEDTDKLTPEQTAKIVAINIRWPQLTEDIRIEEGLLAQLQKLAIMKKEEWPLLDEAKFPRLHQWSRNDCLLDLLRVGYEED